MRRCSAPSSHLTLSFSWDRGDFYVDVSCQTLPSGRTHVFMPSTPSGRPFRRNGKQAMHHEPRVYFRAVTQPLGGRQMRKLNSVVSCTARTTGTCFMRSNVCAMCGASIPFVSTCALSKNRLRGLELRWFERLGKRTLRCASEPTRQKRQVAAPDVASAKIRFAELGTCPIIAVVIARQCRMPLQQQYAQKLTLGQLVYKRIFQPFLGNVGNPELSWPRSSCHRHE